MKKYDQNFLKKGVYFTCSLPTTHPRVSFGIARTHESRTCVWAGDDRRCSKELDRQI